MKYFVIGDIHDIGKGRGDELGSKGRQALREFLNSIPDKSLILNGDILDLLRELLTKIERDDDELLSLMFQKALAYNIGNHDREMSDYLNYRGVQITEKLILGDTLFMHGHQFDLVNSEGRVFGNTITRIVDWLADRIPGVMPWARKVEAWAKRVGRFGSPSRYQELSFEYIKQMEVNGVQIKQIVLNHTHRKDYMEKDGKVYQNSGTWINGKRDFLEVEVL